MNAASWLLWELARTTLLVAVLGVSAWVVLRLARIGSPALHRTCCVAVLLAGWTFVRWPVEVAWYAAPQAPVIEQIAVPVEATQNFSPPIDPALLSPPPEFGAPMSLPPQMPAGTPPAETPPSEVPTRVVSTPAAVWPANWQLPWPQLAIGGWLAGIVAIAATWIIGYLRFWRRLPGDVDTNAEWTAELAAVRAEQGGAGGVTLRVTESAGPLLCRTPRETMLLVPRSMWIALAPHERRAILRHELAHYRRGDLWKSLAVRVLALPHWFNPIAWLAVRRFDEAAEWACDRAAMGEQPTTYAAMLLRLGELASTPARFGSAMSGRPLTTRIRRLITLNTSEDSAMKKALLLTMLLLVAPLTIVRVSLVAEEPAANPLATALQQDAEHLFSESPPVETPDAEHQPRQAAPAAAPSDAPTDAPVRAAQRKMVEMAKRTYEAQDAAYKSGTITLDQMFLWSNLWLSAELAIADSREEQLAAAQGNLARLKEIETSIRRLFETGSRGGERNAMYAANYYVADAERRLAEIEASNDDKSTFPSRSGAFEGEPGEKRPGGGLPTTTTKPAQTSSQTLRSAPEKSSGKAGLRREWPTDASKPTVLPSQTVTLAALRYNGKTFDEWVHELQTDLSPTLRKEAMQALGEFASHGYGKRVAEVIFETMQGYSPWMIDNSAEGQLKESAIHAAKRVPPTELMPVVSSALESDNVNLRLLGLRVMPVDEAKDQVVPLLVVAMKNSNPQVAMMARTHLALVDHDNPAVIASLRQALASGRLAEIENALWFVRGGRLHGTGLEAMTIPPYLQLVSEAVALLDHQDKEIRVAAHDYLFAIGTPLLEPLEEILSSGNASDAVRRLYEEFEAFSVNRRR